MFSNKYRLDKIEEFNKHNPMYDNMEGVVCYLAYFNVGERGWFLYESNDWVSPVHRVHTSVVKEVVNTRGLQVIVTTENTKFTFSVII